MWVAAIYDIHANLPALEAVHSASATSDASLLADFAVGLPSRAERTIHLRLRILSILRRE